MSEKRTKILFFVGGAVFISVAVGVLIRRADGTRIEGEGQTSVLADIREILLQGLHFVEEKAKALSGESKIAKEISKLNKSLKSLPPDSYEASWQLVKAQNEAYVKNHPSR
jgi:hypothetical protein